MINQETQDGLSKLGIDVSKLIEAVKSDEELSLEVPTIDKGFTQEEMTTFGKNRFDEGKNAMSEIMAKSYKEKYGVSMEGKNLDDVVDAIKQKGFEEAKPSEDNKELLKNFQDLQKKYQLAEDELNNKELTHKDELFNISTKQSLISNVPKGAALNADDIVGLYMMKHGIKNNEGSAVVEVNGEIQKDNLLNPLKAEDHFKGWLDTSGLIGKSGMGGDDSKGGSSVAKFKSTKEFYQYAKENGIEPMSEGGQKFLSENKAADFSY